MDDKFLRQNVIDELEFDPSIDAVNIGVAVEDGVVSLSGHVGSYAEKSAVERIVRRVKGVRAIAEDIRARYPYDKKTEDDEIAKRAVAMLEWDVSVPQTVTVTISKGWITLEGEVTWQFQRMAAEQDVRKLSGVIGVINSIVIKPRASEVDIKKTIGDALVRNAHVEAKAIRITVTDGSNVRLDGKVDSWDDRQVVENAAWSVSGVRQVDDRLVYGK
jgi:osmotically-inducible protein OsmY